MSYTIPRINNSDRANADTFNTPIASVESALNDLSGRISAITNKEAILVSGVTVSSDTSLGDLVYRNSGDGVCYPAQALLDTVPGETGASLEAPEARVVGMVVGLTPSGATLLMGGRYASSVCAENCLGAGAAAGTYYLSSVDAGKAVIDPGATLRQPILTYWGAGVFSLGLFYMAHDNHYHESITLTKGWSSAASFTDMDVPLGAQYGYNISLDTELQKLGDLSTNQVSVFRSGTLDHTFIITPENIWATTSPGTDRIDIFTFFPFVYNSPVVRGLLSGSDELTVYGSNGIVTIGLTPYVDKETVKSPTAISRIDGRSLTITPVVSSVTGVGNITVVQNSAGEVYIGESDYIECPLQAMEYNLNGTKKVSDNLYTYIVFPKGVESSVTMSYTLSNTPSSSPSDFSAWFQTLDAQGTVDVALYFLPAASEDTPVTIPTTPLSTASIAVNSSDALLHYYEVGSADRAECSGAGVLIATLTMNNTTNSDVRVLGAGFKLYQASGSSSQPSSYNPSSSYLVAEAPAGTAITANMVVYTQGGALYPASCTDQSTEGRVVGIALNGASIGESVQYIIEGLRTDPSYSFTEGGLLFVGVSGAITQTAPVSPAYIQRIGWALTEHTILVDVSGSIGV